MKTFIGFGVVATIGLWLGGKNPDGQPVLAVIVGVACACIGVFAGRYSARATMRRYEQPKSNTMVNKLAAPNTAIASRLNCGRHWRGVADP